MRSETNRQNVEPISIPKLQTGIEGLDEILQGGIPEGALTLIEGGAGTGKTVLGLEALYNNASAGVPAILVTFEETEQAIGRNAKSMGWDLEKLQKEDKLFVYHVPVDYKSIRSGEFDIKPLLAIIKGHAQKIGAKLLMIDSIDVLLRIFNDPEKEASEIFNLKNWLIENEFTTLMTFKRYSSQFFQKYEFIGFLADCILLLDLRVESQITTRRLRVVKYRGSGFGSNEYPYVIDKGGSTFLPISRMTLNQHTYSEKVSTGIGKLDKLLDGGYQKCTNILLTGPSGTGKTTLACTFVAEMAKKGLKSLYINYEESSEAIIGAMKSPGIDLGPVIDSGLLRFMTTMPEEKGVEQHLLEAFGMIEKYDPEFLILDAISATLRMGSSQAAFTFMMRLIDYCRKKCITCILLNQLDRSKGNDLSGIGISSILDTVILIDFVRVKNEILRSLLIVKSRGSRHSMKYHKYKITDNGIEICGSFDDLVDVSCGFELDPANLCPGKGEQHDQQH